MIYNAKYTTEVRNPTYDSLCLEAFLIQSAYDFNIMLEQVGLNESQIQPLNEGNIEDFFKKAKEIIIKIFNKIKEFIRNIIKKLAQMKNNVKAFFYAKYSQAEYDDYDGDDNTSQQNQPLKTLNEPRFKTNKDKIKFILDELKSKNPKSFSVDILENHKFSLFLYNNALNNRVSKFDLLWARSSEYVDPISASTLKDLLDDYYDNKYKFVEDELKRMEFGNYDERYTKLYGGNVSDSWISKILSELFDICEEAHNLLKDTHSTKFSDIEARLFDILECKDRNIADYPREVSEGIEDEINNKNNLAIQFEKAINNSHSKCIKDLNDVQNEAKSIMRDRGFEGDEVALSIINRFARIYTSRLKENYEFCNEILRFLTRLSAKRTQTYYQIMRFLVHIPIKAYNESAPVSENNIFSSLQLI